MSTLLLRVLFLVTAPIGVSGTTDNSAGGDGWPNGKFKRAIIIGIDGLGGNYLKYMDRTLTPKLWDIINSPAACYNLLARTEYPLDSAPNWVAVLTGMTPSETGILNNKWRVDALDPQSLFDDRVPPVSGPGQLPPTFFSVAKKYNKDIRTASVYSWKWLDKLVDEKSLDHHFMSNDDDGKTADDLIEQLNSDNPPHLAFIQLSEVDNAGHTFSWGSDEYYAALKHMEEIIVNIVGTLRVKEIAKETLIVITSDHGGYKKGHSEWMRYTAEVPIIFFSPYRFMKKSGPDGLSGWLDIKDVAPTVLGAMGIPVGEFQRGGDFSSLF